MPKIKKEFDQTKYQNEYEKKCRKMIRPCSKMAVRGVYIAEAFQRRKTKRQWK